MSSGITVALILVNNNANMDIVNRMLLFILLNILIEDQNEVPTQFQGKCNHFVVARKGPCSRRIICSFLNLHYVLGFVMSDESALKMGAQSAF